MPLHLRSDEDLGAALRAMAGEVAWPAAEPVAGGPDIAALVRARIVREGAAPGRRRRAPWRTPSIVALALDPCAAGARLRDRRPARPRRSGRRRRTRAAGPPDHLRRTIRSALAIRERRAVRGRRCVQDSSAPRQPDGPRRAGQPRRARRASAVPGPDPGGPDHRAAGLGLGGPRPQRPGRAGLAIVGPASRRPQEPGVGLVLTAFRGAVDDGWFTKVLGAGTTAERVRVGGQPGYWVSGDPHFFFYEGPNGPVQESRRWVGDVLLWADGPITYRLETSLGRDAAIAIAETLQ